MDFHHYFLSTSFFFLLFLLPFPSPSLAANDERCHPEDKAALLDFKNSFSNPESLPSWDPDTDCCGWYVVDCDEKTNRVTGLTLVYSSVSGTIPDAVSRLTYLQSLRLHKIPTLIGQIPPSITKLKALDYLDITWTNISGPIPGFLAELQNLKFLVLSFNNLSGTIPHELSRLPSILGRGLDRNRLTGQIPESFGHFVGSVPRLSAFLTTCLRVTYRNLSRTWISPASIYRGISSWETLSMPRKARAQSISRETCWSSIFSGVEFPSSNLVALELYCTTGCLAGSLPSQITEAVYLQFLNVTYSLLCGVIPQGWKLKYRSESFR